MKIYEITFITREEAKDSHVKDDIESLGGKILSVSNLGQKTFVYPIKKEKSGFYTTYIFEIEAEKLQDFNRKLALEEEIVRHLIVAISPTQEITARSKTVDLEVKPETAIDEAQDKELMVEPEKAIEIKPEQEIVEVTEETPETKEETKKEEVKKPTKKIAKETKTKEVKEDKPKEEKAPVAKEEKPKTKKKAAEEEKTAEPVNDEEERLEALDKKLEELLKE